MKSSRNALSLAFIAAAFPSAGSLIAEESTSPASQDPLLEISSPYFDLSANIRAHIQLPSLSCDADELQLNRSLRNNQNMLAKSVDRAAQALGYYSAITEFDMQANGECWKLTVTVEPGEPTIIESLAVQVTEHSELFDSTIKSLPLAEGMQLNHAHYEASKSALASTALELGFLNAGFEHTALRVSPAQHSAAIDLVLNPGQRHRFGELDIDTGGSLSADFVDRFSTFEEGDFYTSEKLLDLRRKLNDSQYFDSVSINPQLDSINAGVVPIKASLVPRPRRVYEYGAGLTTDMGPRLSAYYEDRFKNPRGHRLNATSSLSTTQKSLDADYLIPLLNPSTENLRFSAGFIEENTATFDSRSYRGSAAYTFVNRSNWRQSFFANFRHDEFTLNGERETSDLLIPGFNITKTQADDALVPQRGWRLFLQLRAAEKALLASESFLQLNLNGKWISPLGKGRFISRFELGTNHVDNITKLPASIQFFTGGDQSVRGYDYKSIGASGENETIIGGKSLAVASIEYDHEIASNWRVALFADAGDAFDEPSELSLKSSAGLGIRWVSPIGPVRIDFAHPFDSDESLKLHITMGPDL